MRKKNFQLLLSIIILVVLGFCFSEGVINAQDIRKLNPVNKLKSEKQKDEKTEEPSTEKTTEDEDVSFEDLKTNFNFSDELYKQFETSKEKLDDLEADTNQEKAVIEEVYSEDEDIKEVVKDDNENKVKLVKTPLELDDGNIIYIGGKKKLETTQRSLRIQQEIFKLLIEARINDKEIVESSILPVGGDYIIKINNKKVLTLTDLDAAVNEVSKDVLINRWKHQIDDLIIQSKLTPKEEFEKYLTEPKDLAIALLISILVITIMEMIRINLSKNMTRIVVNSCSKIDEKINYMERDKILKKERDEKIHTISKQFNNILNIIFRVIQIILIVVVFTNLLYLYPLTHDYVKQFFVYWESISFVVRDAVYQWFKSEKFWGTTGTMFLIIITSFVIFYSVGQLGSLLTNIIHVFSEKTKGHSKRLQTISKIIFATIQIIIVIIAIILILQQWGLEITPVLAGAGIVGLAFSFGAQNLIKDIINGIFIVMENQFGIGDIIKINDKCGIVEDMTLRITVLRSIAGIVYIIPNNNINFVEVFTKEWARADVIVGIAYKEDVDTAINIIKDTADKMREEYKDIIISEPDILGVDNLGDSSVDIRILIDTVAGKQWQVKREFKRRIKYAFDQNGIEIPFPHRTLYMGQEKHEMQEDLEFIKKEETE